MNIIRIKEYFKTLGEIESLGQLRRRIIDRFLLWSTAIGTILFLLTLIPAILEKETLVVGFYCILYLCLLSITFLRRLPYWFRLVVYLVILYMCGTVNLGLSGFNVDSSLFFLAFIGLTVFFSGPRGGFIALGAITFTIAIAGVLITQGINPLALPWPAQNPRLWLISGAVFILINLLMVLVFSAVSSSFEQNLNKTSSLTRKIETAFTEQQASEERYRALIEGSMDVIGILSREGIIKYVSSSVEMVLGYTPEEIIGQNIFGSIHPDDMKRAQDAMGPGMPAEQVGPKLDLRVQHKDGTWRDLEVRGREMHTTPGILGTVVSCRDVTIRTRALAELRESSIFLKRMFSGLCDGVIISEGYTDKIMDCNEAAQDMFGYSREELLGKIVVDLHVDPPSFDEFEKKLDLAMKEHNMLAHLEYRLKRKGGSLFPVEISVTPVKDSEGNITGWASVISDISDRKLTERLQAEEREALKQDVFDKTTELQITNERLRELVELSPSVIYSIRAGEGSSPEFVTQNVHRLLGYAPEEILSDPEFWNRHVHPEDTTRVAEELAIAATQNGGVTEYRFLHRDGSYRWIHDEVRVARNSEGDVTALVGSWYDSTDRKLAEEALRASEAKYRTLYTGIRDAFVSTDMEGLIIDFNEIYQDMLGYPPEELHRLTYIDLTPEKWQPIEADIVQKQILVRGYSDIYEKEYFRKDGTIFPVELRTMLVRDNDGNPSGMWALIRDISDRKKTENILQTSEERYRILAEAAHDMIYIIDTEDRILYVNTFAASSFNLQPNDLIGKLRSDYFRAESGEQQAKHLAQVFDSGDPVYDELMIEFPGSKVWLSTWVVPLKDASGKTTAVLGVSRDITTRKNAEATLQRFSEKLEEQVAERTQELTESHTQLRNLANQVIKLQEDERRRISRELHDEAGQALILLKFNLDSLLVEIPNEDKAVQKKLSDSVRIIDQTMGLIRNLSHSLRPPVMDVGGLNLSLRELSWDFSQSSGLKINYTGEDIQGLPDEIGISLYRFAQEALVNIVKHSQATRVDIRLVNKNGCLTLCVRDNGKGLEERRNSRGIGLMGIEERISLLGGTLVVDSTPGKGLRLTARVPWTVEPAGA